MKIIRRFNQHRRDFRADMQCEHCGTVRLDVSCYDDDFFHRKVIPDMACSDCGEKSPEDNIPQGTKYASGGSGMKYEFRIHKWFDTATLKPNYGIQARQVTEGFPNPLSEWMHCHSNGKVLMYSDWDHAARNRDELTEMKS